MQQQAELTDHRVIELFNGFDPKGDAPHTAVLDMHPLALRARKLLRRRGREHVLTLAVFVASIIDEWFHEREEEEIQRHLSPNDPMWSYVQSDKPRTADSLRELFGAGLPRGAQMLCNEYPTYWNTQMLDVLKTVAFQYRLDTNGYLPADTRPFELFAVLALQLIGYALTFLERVGSNAFPLSKTEHNRNLSEANQAQMEALEAILFAEHLRDSEERNSATAKAASSALKEFARAGGKARHRQTDLVKQELRRRWERGEFETKAAAARWAFRVHGVSQQAAARWLPARTKSNEGHQP